MSKRYFVWKNRECNGINPEWLEISGLEFYELLKEEPKRYFKRIDDGIEDGADMLIFETTYDDYKEWHRKQERKRRRKKVNQKTEMKTVHLEDLIQDADYTYEDLISEDSDSVESKALRQYNLELLKNAIEDLNQKERDAVEIMLEAYIQNISERSVCRRKGIDQGTFMYRKKMIINRLKSVLKCE